MRQANVGQIALATNSNNWLVAKSVITPTVNYLTKSDIWPERRMKSIIVLIATAYYSSYSSQLWRLAEN